MSDANDTAPNRASLHDDFDRACGVLRGRQRRFVEEYLRDLHGQSAAIRAGYSQETARSQASRMLTNVNIRAAVQLGLELQTMPQSEVLARLANQARGSMADFLRVDEEEVTLTWSLVQVGETDDGEPDEAAAILHLAGQEHVQPTDRVLRTATVTRSVARLDLLAAGAAGKLGLVKKYAVDKDGKESIELYDAQAALQLLGKTHRLFVDRQELSGPNGEAITVRAEDIAAARAAAQQFEQETFGE